MTELARLNVTWAGANGDLPDPVPYDLTDDQLRAIATEAIQTGGLSGIATDRRVDLRDFVVDRFAATPEIPHHRFFIRPKTPFGRMTN